VFGFARDNFSKQGIKKLTRVNQRSELTSMLVDKCAWQALKELCDPWSDGRESRWRVAGGKLVLENLEALKCIALLDMCLHVSLIRNKIYVITCTLLRYKMACANFPFRRLHSTGWRLPKDISLLGQSLSFWDEFVINVRRYCHSEKRSLCVGISSNY